VAKSCIFTGVFVKSGDCHTAYAEELPAAVTQERTLEETQDTTQAPGQDVLRADDLNKAPKRVVEMPKQRFSDVVLPKHELLEVNRSKISLHRAKAGYSYPTIRLPYAFSKLAGLPTRIYQTVHEGSLAFLVVISPRENT